MTLPAAPVPVVPGADAPVTELGAALALAGEMGLTLITVDQPSLLSKWVGESEKGLREVFKRAEAEVLVLRKWEDRKLAYEITTIIASGKNYITRPRTGT